MDVQKVQRTVVVTNPQGLHARPAEMFVRLARQFESRIELDRDGRRVEATNIIDLLTLGAAKGTELVLVAEGSDAQDAVDALAKLVDSGFHQEEAGQVQTQTEEKK